MAFDPDLTDNARPTPWLDGMGRPVPTDIDLSAILHRVMDNIGAAHNVLLEGKLWIGNTVVWFQQAPGTPSPNIRQFPEGQSIDTPTGIAPRMQFQLRLAEFEWEAHLAISTRLVEGSTPNLWPGVSGYEICHRGRFENPHITEYEIYLDRLYQQPADAMQVLRDWLTGLALLDMQRSLAQE